MQFIHKLILHRFIFLKLIAVEIKHDRYKCAYSMDDDQRSLKRRNILPKITLLVGTELKYQPVSLTSNPVP